MEYSSNKDVNNGIYLSKKIYLKNDLTMDIKTDTILTILLKMEVH